jgi:RNA polymerase sigma-70 factor (ECF subfamily)
MSLEMGTNPGIQDECTDGETIVASMHEPARFAAIFDRHYDQILAYLARRVDRALAEELVSETFVRAFAGRGRYDPAYQDARPWLFRIATNLLRKHVRSSGRRRRAYARALERDENTGGLEGVAERVDAALEARTVAGELSRLRPTDRETLLLFALTDLGYEGIAIATGVPVGTVRSRLHRARRHLQSALSSDAGMPGHPITKRSGYES